MYKNKSVAEQNSIDLAWDLLMSNEYSELRKCIYTTKEEFQRFRQLVVNVILATDIFDKELSALRKKPSMYITPMMESVDIDTPDDWDLACAVAEIKHNTAKAAE